MGKERIGILGGTFNPLHEGHIAMARAALEKCSLERLLFLPDSVPPHKTGIAPALDRWRMVVAATAFEPRFEPCRMELERTGTTYTYDTLTALRAAYPKAELCYLIGTDTLMELHHWYRWQEVLKLCTFLVCPRTTQYSVEQLLEQRRMLISLGASFQDVEMPVVNVSSTELRQAIAEDTPTDLLSPVEREYIGLCGLYGTQTRIQRHEEWLSRLFSDLNAKRFAHTLGVAYTARQLAILHHVDQQKAEVAALLHDCAKCLPLKEMQRIAEEHQLTSDESLKSSGALLHALVGSHMAQEVYGVTDRDILQAIACHTTGKAGMSPLDMVVYLADKIEPTRTAYPLLHKVRMIAPLSLEKAVCATMKGSANHVRDTGKKPHPDTLAAIDWLEERIAQS